MIKICLICPHLPPMSFPCGAAHFVFLLAQGLVKKGAEVTIVHSNPKAASITGVKFISVSGWGFFDMRQLAKKLKSLEFDIVDLQYEAFMYGQKGAVLLLPFLLPQEKNILTLHSAYLPSFFSPLWRLVQIFFFKRIIFYSENFLERIKGRFKKRAHHFKFQGFPSNIVFDRTVPALEALRYFRQMKHLPQNEATLQGVYFGHLAQNRGIENLLLVIKELKENHQIKFLFMGQFRPSENDYHQELTRLVAHFDLQSEVHFSGQLSDSEVSLVLQGSDYAVLPFPEGASLKNGSLSAIFSHGLPVLSTKTKESDELLFNSKAVLSYSPGDLKGLKDEWVKLLTDRILRHELSTNSKNLSPVFSWENYLEKRMSIYRELIEAP